jgi:hypothetical protein
MDITSLPSFVLVLFFCVQVRRNGVSSSCSGMEEVALPTRFWYHASVYIPRGLRFTN